MLSASQVFLALGLTSSVAAQGTGFVPLVQKQFEWGNIPYKVDTDVGLPRGPQIGYNICNSTTEGPESLCQTAVFNSLDDFCIWAPPEPGKEVGAIEGEMVAWCTKGGHGTRIFPDGTITGVQFTKAPAYVQVVGFMDQTKINMLRGDAGGEMDPHGADLRGNPMGGILYSQAFTGSYVQVMEWHNFNGANMFCLKACDPRGADDDKFCEHIYDTQGCGFNAPSNAKDGVFESCASDNQPFPGQGVQVPASSLCSTFASTDIYGASATVAVPIPGASTMTFATSQNPPRPTPSSSGAGGVSSGASVTRSGGASQPSQGQNDEGSALKFTPNAVLAVVAGLFAFLL